METIAENWDGDATKEYRAARLFLKEMMKGGTITTTYFIGSYKDKIAQTVKKVF